ncbi:hypothetical protein QYF61_011772 [Mycteria americana]|uniref:Uncharacterized protein n=1 Tax=Mycteria americana TaxID=33587 RepID=A0AAN7N3C5_MYCAM|nr:hypothetical protein QYF61_011772 [Mycteria americana]
MLLPLDSRFWGNGNPPDRLLLEMLESPFTRQQTGTAAQRSEVTKGKNAVLGSPRVVQEPREMEVLLSQRVTQAVSPWQRHRYELILLMAENIRVKWCNTLNPNSHPSNGGRNSTIALVTTHEAKKT